MDGQNPKEEKVLDGNDGQTTATFEWIENTTFAAKGGKSFMGENHRIVDATVLISESFEIMKDRGNRVPQARRNDRRENVRIDV